MTNTVLRLRQRIADARGQVVIALIPMLFLFMVGGVLAVDTGALFSDRRDAQGDVDNAALAAAQAFSLEKTSGQCFGSPADCDQTQGTDVAAAVGLAKVYIERNGGPAATATDNCAGLGRCIKVSADCFANNQIGSIDIADRVTVSIRRTPPTFFLGYFASSWNTFATASACAGRQDTSATFLPIALGSACANLDHGDRCWIDMQGFGNSTTGYEIGLARNGTNHCTTGSTSNAVLLQTILLGYNVVCSVGDIVKTSNGGGGLTNTQQAFICRLKGTAAAEAWRHNTCQGGGGWPIVDGEGHCVTPDSVAAYPSTKPDSWNSYWFGFVGEPWPLDTTEPRQGGGAAFIHAGPAKTNGGSGNNPPTFMSYPLADMDDMWQVWAYDATAANPAANITELDCGANGSPRNVGLFIVDATGQQPNEAKVTGFARGYLEGCAIEQSFGSGQHLVTQMVLYPQCDFTASPVNNTFYLVVRFLSQVAAPTGASPSDVTGLGDVGVFLRQ
jgi:hypothetical protein